MDVFIGDDEPETKKEKFFFHNWQHITLWQDLIGDLEQ